MNAELLNAVFPWATVLGFIVGLSGKWKLLALFIVVWSVFGIYCLLT